MAATRKSSCEMTRSEIMHNAVEPYFEQITAVEPIVP